MPSIEAFFCWQQALLWPFQGWDRYGQPVVSEYPQEIQVTWTTSRREILDKQGNTITLDAEAIVQFPIAIQSQMWLGTLDEYNSLTGTAAIEIHEVKTYKSNVDAKGRFVRAQVGLLKLHNPPGGS